MVVFLRTRRDHEGMGTGVSGQWNLELPLHFIQLQRCATCRHGSLVRGIRSYVIPELPQRRETR